MFQWQLEELRVSLFAQELKTPYPVSVKRLLKEWDSFEVGRALMPDTAGYRMLILSGINARPTAAT